MSAQLDGEPGVLLAGTVERHLAGCRACRVWRADVEAMQRRLRVGVAPVMSDQTERFVAAVQSERERQTRERRRLLPVQVSLVVVALTQLALSTPVLLLGHEQATPEHVAHELGAFSVALAVGLLLAALRPRLATGMVPIVGAVALLLVLTAWIDAVLRHTQITLELPHLLEVAGFLLLLRLASLSNDRNRTPLLLPLRRAPARRPDGTATAPTAALDLRPDGPVALSPERRAVGE